MKVDGFTGGEVVAQGKNCSGVRVTLLKPSPSVFGPGVGFSPSPKAPPSSTLHAVLTVAAEETGFVCAVGAVPTPLCSTPIAAIEPQDMPHRDHRVHHDRVTTRDLLNDPSCLRSPPMRATRVPRAGPSPSLLSLGGMGMRLDGSDESTPPPCSTSSMLTISTLADLLEHAQPGAFVALDIDDTICCNRYHPCFLMTDPGLAAFRATLCEDPCKKLPFKEKNDMTRDLQAALRDKKLIESDTTSNVIRELQDRGCWVFGLTARYSEMASMTRKVLANLGVDLSLTAPFPPSLLRDPETGAVCADGIIYSNAEDKGRVLDRFLANIVFRDILAGGTSAEEDRPNSQLPPAILFVDDRLNNVESVLEGLSVVRELAIPVKCFHYTADMTLPGLAAASSPVRELDRMVMMKQVGHFIETRTVLDNASAALLLTTNHQPPTTNHQPPTTNHQPSTTNHQPPTTPARASPPALPTRRATLPIAVPGSGGGVGFGQPTDAAAASVPHKRPAPRSPPTSMLEAPSSISPPSDPCDPPRGPSRSKRRGRGRGRGVRWVKAF